MGKVSHRVKKVYTIYALIDPRTSTETHPVRYIGITYDVYQRMRQHSRCEGDNELKNAWVRELQKEQLMFTMHSIEKVNTIERALERESYWIQHYLKLGAKLTNLAGTSAKPVKPIGPKWVISPQEALLLFFRDSTEQLVNVPFAPHEEFDVFVKRYVHIKEGPRDGFWDKSNRRNVLSYIIKNGLRPALFDENGNPVEVDWPQPPPVVEKKIEARVLPVSNPYVGITSNEECQVFQCLHNITDIEDALKYADGLIGCTLSIDPLRVYTIKNTMLADDLSSNPDLRIICFASRYLKGSNPT